MTPSSQLCGWTSAAGVALALLTVPAVPVAQTIATVVMSGLDSPRGLAFGPEGALYVTEAGRGAGVVEIPGADRRCYTGPLGGTQCYGPSGAISRLWGGVQT